MISNVAQTNTFTGGMNMDSDINYLQNSEYRYAENIRVVTNEDGTTGVLQNIEGVKAYAQQIPAGETILGTTTIKDIGVVITKDTTGRNKVYTIVNFDSPAPLVTCKVKGYLGLCEDIEKTPNVSIVANYETDTNIKIYFTDGNSAIKMLNIADDKYQSGAYVDDNGDIINTLALDITPGANLAPFEIVDLNIGSLPVGTVQYCYQLFNLHEQETTLSPLSEMVHLTTSSTNTGSQSYMGEYAGVSSGKSCILRAPLYTHHFDKCRIISIRYEYNNQNPTIVIVDEISIDPTLNEINYTDTGNSYMGEISIEEFNNLTGYQFAAKTIAKKDNRLFAANIKEESWNPKYDARAYRANTGGQVKLTASGGNTLTFFFDQLTEDTVPEDHDCINPYNTTPFSDSGLTQWAYNADGELGGTGLNISYNFITAPIKLSKVQAGYRADNDCSMNVPAEYINQLTCTNVGYDTTFTVKFSNSASLRTPNYADPNIAATFKSYQRDEIYRFGIIFYNQKSLPSPVYWIGDIRMPHSSQVPPFVYKDNTLYGQALGIRFTVKNVPEGAVAYEIVRCDRTEADRTVVMNVVGSVIKEYLILDEEEKPGHGEVNESSLESRPTIFFYNSHVPLYFNREIDRVTQDEGSMAVISAQRAVEDYLRLVSPEICLQREEIESVFRDVYLEMIGKYYSIIDDTLPSNTISDSTKSPTVIFTTANSVLQSDGTIKYLKKDAFVQWNSDRTKYVFSFADNSSTGNDQVMYPAHIAKYYYTEFTGTGDSNGNNDFYITDAKYPLDIPYNAFDNGTAAYKINVGGRTYTNYAMTDFEHNNRQAACGPAGPCVVVYMQNSGGDFATYTPTIQHNTLDSISGVHIFNLKKNVSSQYGGNTYSTRQNSIYISTNSYLNLSTTSAGSNIVDTFGGDTYLGLLDYPNTFTFQANAESGEGSYEDDRVFFGSYIPFESSINLNLFNGDMVHRTVTSENYVDSHLELDPTQKGNYHSQDRPYYAYNTVYSSQTGSKQYVPPAIYDEDNLTVTNRIYSSQAKVNNEILDNWTVFKTADYLDVDNQYGDVTNMLNFKDRLFYWQDTALGIASVNERALIQDNNVGQLTLGTGGVLARYDYITTTNGSSIVNDRSIVTSDNTLYWYDYDKNEICSMQGNQVLSLSKTKNVQSYLNELYTKKRDVTLAVFDKKYNELWFKFYDKSLIFSEQLNKFTSFYTFNPEWALTFSDKIVAIKDNLLYRVNSLDTDSSDTNNKDAKITLVVNTNPEATKVFDNVRISGQFLDANGALLTTQNIGTMEFLTKHQQSDIHNIVFDYREDTYRFPIPRQKDSEDISTYTPRLRGKYLISNYNFTVNGEQTFRIPFITTTYRQSLL